ncbi:aldo/keto reductase [Hujiaoplasma nucleasis]|uniref:Aldo/keto reductase n=1 Tax=Hujiaoplasma nucleasis TaxID=2725268 RepID=A0A7L6N1S9_9MOLU|nr:aldo/keto reductase [Hujiaoplasma nucleasis]QLY39531.1 aldo/keto reductase [Hujiaoplasma nucleasis]
MSKILNEFIELANGVKIPKIGFGTWQIENGDEAYQSVTNALKNGYIHIDSANGYGNEASVGQAIKDSKIPRDQIFVTSKLPSHIKNYEEAKKSFEETLNNFGFDYVDLYLIHAPWPWSNIGSKHDQGNVEAWKAMEEYYKAGKIRAIGVSNFSPSDIQNIIDHCEIVPLVNQIGFWIGRDQEDTLDYCKKHNILVEAYSPLATGKILKNPTIVEISKKYKVTPAQLCIRYCLEKDTIPLPKSTHEDRIIQNSQVNFKISQEDLKVLENLKTN